MQSLIALSCLLAVASAGYLNNAAVSGVYGGALGYAGNAVAYNAPISGVYGGALGYAGNAVAYNAPISGVYGGALGYAGNAVAYNAPISGVYGGALGYASNSLAYNAPLVAAPHAYNTPYYGPLADAYAANTGPIGHAGLVSEARLIDPVAIASGAPLPTGDTVEVASAKAAHLQAHAAVKGLSYAAPVAHAYSAPIAHSYAAPLATGYAYASNVAHGYAAPIAHGYAHAGLVSEARLVDPVAVAAGAPLPTGDTVEVAAAKAAHYAAHAAAKGHFIAKRSPGYLGAAAYAAPLAYSGYASPLAYSGYASPLAYSSVNGYGYGGHYAGHIYG